MNFQQSTKDSIHSRLIQSIFFASACPILFPELMAFQSQIERQSQNTERAEMIKNGNLYKV